MKADDVRVGLPVWVSPTHGTIPDQPAVLESDVRGGGRPIVKVRYEGSGTVVWAALGRVRPRHQGDTP